MTEWKTIDSAPWDKRVLLWWTPVDDNPYAECAVTGAVSTSGEDYLVDDYKPSKYWDGKWPDNGDWKEGYKDLDRITHWMPLPNPPKESEV